MNEQKSSAKKRNPLFWRNVGLFFSAFASVVLVCVLLIADLHLLKADINFQQQISALENTLMSTQQSVVQFQDALQNVERQSQQNNQAIADLKQHPTTDILPDALTNAFTHLTDLDNKLDRLQLIQQNRLSLEETTQPVIAQTRWEHIEQIISELFWRLVSVHHTTNALPFVTPDSQIFLKQNLHAQLLMAEWALLHREPTIYQATLQKLSLWIKQYGEPQADLTKQVLSELNVLQTIDVQRPKGQAT